MNNKKSINVIYFAPTTLYHFNRWEYYQVEYEQLKKTCEKVIVVHSFSSFLKEFLGNKVDLIYCFWWHTSAPIVVLSYIFKIKCYVIGAVHMYDESGSPDFFKKSFFFRLACRISWRYAYRNLFISKSQMRQITSHEYTRNGIVFNSPLHPNFNLENINLERASEKDGVIKFLTIIWMTKDQLNRKGFYQVLDAINELAKEKKYNFTWYIAGGSSDGTEMVKQKIKENNLENFVKLEFDISNEKKNHLYANCDLFIQPSFYEGFGNAVLEAMSFGTPALVSGYCSQPEVVKNSGYITNEISSNSIKKILIKFLKLSNKERMDIRKQTINTVKENHIFKFRYEQFCKILNEDFN